MIIDVDSRYVVAWTIAQAETGELADAFIANAVDGQQVDRDQLTLQDDRQGNSTNARAMLPWLELSRRRAGR